MTEKFQYDKYIILHGCPPSEALVTPKEKRWMNWLEKELQNRSLNALAPDMPISWKPKYVEWKQEFEKYPVTEDTMFIGHSCGAAFMVRWLLETNKHVKKLILVAPAKVPEGDNDPRRDLYDFDFPRDAAKIADEIVVFTSNDAPHHLQSLEMYKNALHPRVERLENKQHFLFFQTGTNEFPELLNEVLK
jgi:hypothetical protein